MRSIHGSSSYDDLVGTLIDRGWALKKVVISVDHFGVPFTYVTHGLN